jgi:hypothetical protein
VIGQRSLAETQARTESSPYGLGVGHSGGNIGVLSEVRRFPDVDATLVLHTNGGDGGVTSGLFDRLWDDAVQTALGDL